MSIPPKKQRELLLQWLYSRETNSQDEEGTQALLMGELKVTRRSVREVGEYARKIDSECEAIDQRLRAITQSYALERIQKVELSILRLATYEILFDEAIPPKVSIAEGLRLARKFCTAEAANFVNAVLDAVYKQEIGCTPDEKFLSETTESLIDSEKHIQETVNADENPDDHI